MITFLVGPPGSGKTLISLQRYVLAALRGGRKVFHNIRGLDPVNIAYHLGMDPYDVENALEYMYSPCILEWAQKNFKAGEYRRLGSDAFERRHAKHLEAFYKIKAEDILKKIPMLPDKYLIVLDEAQNFIGANDHKEKKNVEFFEYATTHRQEGHELLIVTQHEDNVDVKIRRISNLLIYLFRLDVLGALFKNSVKEKHYNGCSGGAPELVAKRTTRYDKRLFKLYRSYVSDDVVEVRQFPIVWRNGILIALALLLLLLLFGVPQKLMSRLAFGVSGAVKVAPSPVPAPALTPSLYLGEHEDYYCGERLVYVLRPGGSVDSSLSSVGVPAYVCPYKNFHFNEAKK